MQTTLGMTPENVSRFLTMPESEHATDIDAVIGALARHEPHALAVAIGTVIGHADLQGGVDCFRA